jgi:hypothetical protein
MSSKASWIIRLAYPVIPLAGTLLVGLAPNSARADFFDDARKAFTSDIPRFFQNDVPHFFQDDIPCAFGGQPTSHTKTSCKGPAKPAGKQPASKQPATGQQPDGNAAAPDDDAAQ